ncbi:MAG: hypothetical protein ACYTKD_13045 [Planctomycetota bacterium]|jgi:hypothetical protein
MADDGIDGDAAPDGADEGNARVSDPADRDPELVSPVAVVALGILTAGLYPVWVLLPRMARHRRLTGLAPRAAEALGEPPRSAGPNAQESLVPWAFTIAWLLLATAMAFGAAIALRPAPTMVFGLSRRPGPARLALSAYTLAAGILGALAFPAAVQVYARWYLGAIRRREMAALGRAAERLGGKPPALDLAPSRWLLGYRVLATAAVVAPPVILLAAASLWQQWFFLLVFAAITLVVVSVWALTMGPAMTAVLFNSHVRACGAAQTWLRERVALAAGGGEPGGRNANA